MGKKQGKSADEPRRHAGMQIGTSRLALQVPDGISGDFRRDVDHRGPQSIRFMGTCAVGLLMGMPADIRDKLFRHVQRVRWEEMREVTSQEVWALFETLYSIQKRESGPARGGKKHA